MVTTFLKRQKEMKRKDKQREKAERRAQKKIADRARAEAGDQSPVDIDLDPMSDPDLAPAPGWETEQEANFGPGGRH
jgi:hypothetical protein